MGNEFFFGKNNIKFPPKNVCVLVKTIPDKTGQVHFYFANRNNFRNPNSCFKSAKKCWYGSKISSTKIHNKPLFFSDLIVDSWSFINTFSFI